MGPTVRFLQLYGKGSIVCACQVYQPDLDLPSKPCSAPQFPINMGLNINISVWTENKSLSLGKIAVCYHSKLAVLATAAAYY